MDPSYYILIGCLAAFGGLAIGWLGAWLLDRSRLQGVHARAVEIAAAAKVEAEQIVKEAELKTKDELYRKHEEFNHETESTRQELREQERRLDKREDGLEEKSQALTKKERALEHSQRKLTERKAEVEKRSTEVEQLVKLQTQKLHEISGLGREQGEALLLERLEHELSEVVASRLLKHEENLPSVARRKRGASWPRPFTATPPSIPRTPRSAPWIFPATT